MKYTYMRPSESWPGKGNAAQIFKLSASRSSQSLSLLQLQDSQKVARVRQFKLQQEKLKISAPSGGNCAAPDVPAICLAACPKRLKLCLLT